MKNISELVNNKFIACEVLTEFLELYLNPAFGVLPKKEIDLLVLNILIRFNYINEEPAIYELVQKLKVTRSKARNLLYDRELRRMDSIDLNQITIELLKKPIIQKDGNLYLFEIDNPLLLDHIKSKVKTLGFLTDGSFSPGIVKLSLNAFVALMDFYINKENQKNIKKALIKAGAPDNSFKNIMKGILKQLGKQLAQDAGEALAEKAGDFISPIIDSSLDKIQRIFVDFFKSSKSDNKSI